MRFALKCRLLVLVGGFVFAGAPAPAEEKPNILLLVADDLGWNDVGWHGAPIKTPNMDRLVREGVELDQHYVQPVCTPTRTALMSGRYPSRFGPHALRPSNLRAMPLGTTTVASALQSVGYATFQSGKWHLGSRVEWGPNHYGFQHSYGSLTGAVDPWTHQYREGLYAKTWHRDFTPLDEYGKGNVTEQTAAQAERWIHEKRQPWFIYMAFNAVHIPVDTPDIYKRLHAGQKFSDDPQKDESRHRLAAFVSQLDAKIGQLVAALDESGQRRRTLVVFTSDNGGLLKGGNAYVSKVPPTPALSSNEPLRGQKGELYEGGIRVPAFVNWPGVLKPGKVTAPMHAVDWFPTLAALVGYKPPQDLGWDGRNMWPAITGQVSSIEPRTLYWPYHKGNAVRHGDWKLIVDPNGAVQLFDLANDPYERTDLAEREPARVKDLRAKLDALQRRDRKELPEDLKEVPK